MTKRFSIASAVLTLFAAILASMLVVAVPAFAGPSGAVRHLNPSLHWYQCQSYPGISWC